MAIASLRQHRARWSGLLLLYPLPLAVRGSSARSAFTRFFNPNRSNTTTASYPPGTVHPSLRLHAFFTQNAKFFRSLKIRVGKGRARLVVSGLSRGGYL